MAATIGKKLQSDQPVRVLRPDAKRAEGSAHKSNDVAKSNIEWLYTAGFQNTGLKIHDEQIWMKKFPSAMRVLAERRRLLSQAPILITIKAVDTGGAFCLKAYVPSYALQHVVKISKFVHMKLPPIQKPKVPILYDLQDHLDKLGSNI
jgi:hypothetical protein